MTQEEFSYWQARTESSRYQWTEDEIFRLNGRGAKYYIGGEDGTYMRIEKDGLLEIGTYEGAIPHIGDAFFKPEIEKQYKNFDTAFTAAIGLGGKKFLVDMFSGNMPIQPMPPQEKEHDNIECRADFQCDQTEGFPTSLVMNWTQNTAFLELNESLVLDRDEMELDYYKQLCKDWGIRPCHSEEDYNELLKSLDDEAYENAAFDLSENEQSFKMEFPHLFCLLIPINIAYFQRIIKRFLRKFAIRHEYSCVISATIEQYSR